MQRKGSGMSDLVKRLRAGIDPSTQITLGGKKHDGRSLEAADRIEQLDAAINAALGRLDASLFTNAEHQQAKDILREATR